MICETKIFTKVLQYTRSDLSLRRVATTSFATSCRLVCTAALTHRSRIPEKVGKTHSNTPRNIQFAAQFRRKTRSITSSFYKITKTRVHPTLHAPPHETTCPASHHPPKTGLYQFVKPSYWEVAIFNSSPPSIHGRPPF